MGETPVEGRPLTDEQELVENAKRGDVSAYGQLVAMHQSMALRVAYLILRDHAEAEDVTQDAFVKAYHNLRRFRVGAPFRPWVLRIVRNEALNRRRGSGRRERLAVRVAADPVSGGAAPSPETEVVARERDRRVLDAVDALPPKYRQVIEARYLAGLSEAETARLLGMAAGTVKSRTSRAMARLREQLGEADV